MARSLALVTGASAGIGRAYAEALAARGSDLVLVARREAALRELADALAAAYGISATVIPADLEHPGAATALAEQVAARGLAVDTLINNAGFGLYGPFAEADAERLTAMNELNVVALTALTRAFVPVMRTRGRGAIVNVASVAGFQAVPNFAVYAATKAYVLSFSEALAEELRPDGIVVQALCPGTTRTEFFEVAGMPAQARIRFMSPEAVVAASLAGLERRQVVVVPGLANQVAAHGGRLLPRAWLTRLAAMVMKGH